MSCPLAGKVRGQAGTSPDDKFSAAATEAVAVAVSAAAAGAAPAPATGQVRYRRVVYTQLDFGDLEIHFLTTPKGKGLMMSAFATSLTSSKSDTRKEPDGCEY
jgi:hypothetical protein